jgi:hypothetical protein
MTNHCYFSYHVMCDAIRDAKRTAGDRVRRCVTCCVIAAGGKDNCTENAAGSADDDV